ncbi:hypothetical protein AQ619_17665 [Caulobacter henricii]|uniref:2,4-dihydroxyhept-2-ene-1,7-dioic acid aldolase n=1 Tax=Caulobacter henricii TaxID=69395 RepID=A0A0P0P4G8_9CAUL|nr:hypothetical protein AQ619_17665 [Caulobacter henricii]
MQSHARLTTDKAARYMTQLARHWGHRFVVTFDETTARIPLPSGDCRMVADETGLDITVETSGREGLARLEEVVADHLLRFAFREDVETLGWTRAREAGRIDPQRVRLGQGRG